MLHTGPFGSGKEDTGQKTSVTWKKGQSMALIVSNIMSSFAHLLNHMYQILDLREIHSSSISKYEKQNIPKLTLP